MLQKIKLTRDELMEILGVKTTAMKDIERQNKLNDRLLEKGYEFVEKIKEGRSNYYIVSKEDNADDKDVLTNIIRCCYKTREYLTFSEYYTIRYVFGKMEWQGATTDSISEYIGVSKSLVSKWDKILKENDMIKQDGYYYYKLDTESYEESQIDESEYKAYWTNTKDLQAMKRLQNKYDKGEITFNELRVSISEYEKTHEAIEGKYCYKVKKYIINELNLLCGDIWKLIKKCYLTDIGVEYLKIHKK